MGWPAHRALDLVTMALLSVEELWPDLLLNLEDNY